MITNSSKFVGDSKEIGMALNRLAREQMKTMLLRDIRMDINVCQIEGFDYKDYLQELRDMIDSFIKE